MMKKLIMMMVVAVTCMGIAETVTNVRGSQRQDSKLVDIYYDLNATDGGTYTVAVEVEGRTSAVTASTFTGDVGEGVSLGTNRHIVWDAGTDWPDKKGDVRAVVTTTKENPAMSHDMVQLWAGGPYWATKNIGANNPWDYGLYFWWGDTMGHRVTASNCPTYGKSTDQLHSEGWITSNGVLASAHDAAHVQWGGNWRMPTSGELSDLNSKCDWTWKTMNGVDGYVVRGRGAYASNSIFLPAARFDGGISLGNSSAYGCYWSSVLNSDNDRSWYLDFNSDYHDTDYNYRWFGFSVRPVQGVTSGSTTATTTGSSDWFFVDTTDKTLTLTVESADWANGSITLCCTDEDTSGVPHTYTLQYCDVDTEVWMTVDNANNITSDASGHTLLTDTSFSSNLEGICPVKYRVMDENIRISEELVTRNRHGIYVGIDVYEHTSGLNSCVDDANNIRSAFSDYGECRNNHSLLNSDAKKQEILDKIDELTEKVNVGDILLFYFSGHGAQGGYLCCHDSNNRAETNISANELATHLHYFPHGLGLVVMLDACYSTGMILLDRTVPSMMSAQVVPVESTTSGNLAQDFAEQVSQCLDALCQTERLPRLMSTGASSITSASRQGLSSSEIGWITSSQADETSLEVGGKSIFTHEGIYSRGWLKGRADSDKNEVVTFGELGKWGMSWMAKVYARYHRMSSYYNIQILDNVVAGRVPPHGFWMLLAEPSGVMAQKGADGEINLSWESVEGANSYAVFRSVKGSAETNYVTSVSGLSYVDGRAFALDPNLEYEYYVQAENEVDVSEASVTTSGTVTENTQLRDFVTTHMTDVKMEALHISEHMPVENGTVNYSNLNYDHDGDGLTTFQEYVTGSDPADKMSSFRGNITMSNGVPQVTWSPNLKTNGEVRAYTVWGKTNLTDEVWHTPTNSASRFFKVTVEMP